MIKFKSTFPFIYNNPRATTNKPVTTPNPTQPLTAAQVFSFIPPTSAPTPKVSVTSKGKKYYSVRDPQTGRWTKIS